MFIFDKVFKPSATQEDVYNVGAKPIVSGKPIYLTFHLYQYLIWKVS